MPKRKHILLINSADTSSPNKYDAYYNMNDEYLHNTKSVQFKSITFSNTMYNINQYNNTLNYEVAGVPATVNIPVGSYNVSTFVVAFNAAQASIVIADNATTKKFSFTSTPLTKILATSTLNRILGITVDTANATSYSANQIYNFIYTYMIHLISNHLAENDNVISSNNNKYAIIASIPLDVGFAFVKFHDENLDSSDYSVFVGHSNVSTLNIKIVDDYFRTVDLNGSDYVIEFTVKTD